MNEPESRIPDELLSAYLDGELSPAEQEQVDHALANDDGLQALLTDLHQVRTDVQRLPRHKLPASFSDRVLQSCRRRPGGSWSLPHISLHAKKRRMVVSLLAIAATVMIAAWAIGPARWGGPAVRWQVASHDGIAAESADPADQNSVKLGGDLVETEGVSRPNSDMEIFKAPDEAVTRGSADTARGSLTDLSAGAAAQGQLGRRPKSSQSKSAAREESAEADTEAIARVELTFPLEKIAQIKAQLQGPQTKQLGLKVTDLRNETLSEIRVAEKDGVVRPDVAFYSYQKNVEPAELLLVEGTPDQIATAVRQLDIVSTNISDLTAQQLEAVSPPAAVGSGLSVRDGKEDLIQRLAEDHKARYRGILNQVGDTAPSQTAKELAAADGRLAELADKSKDDAATGRIDFAAAPKGQTDTPSLVRGRAPASASPKAARSSSERRSREREGVTGAAPRYQILFVLLREAAN